MKSVFCLLAAVAGLSAQTASLDFLNHNRPVLDAHNCYPYDGQWADRIDRALKTGFPISIEQDIAWAVDPASGKGRPVVTHTPQTTGREPTLRDHFFERVRPIVEKALADNDRARWPLIVLHFDFKSLDPQLLRAVWEELGEFQSWITTAPQTSEPGQLGPFDPKPLLVITESADAQEEVFFKGIPKDARLRVFGSAHTAPLAAKSPAERAHLAATAPPEQLLTERPTNYRRWWNNSWAEVEEGGQAKAGPWTPAAAARLQALVDHAHRLGFWIRFYTLDGFAPGAGLGWGEGYGVNFVATDQYEDLAAVMKENHLR
ncbi:conserved exported hypothetical protein [Candidatus Sulfopaludibacter sp. SbA3]|nr:conserved exported hypothetical protein [Candidatus Sulfopaludibacter sp. SbA3]